MKHIKTFTKNNGNQPVIDWIESLDKSFQVRIFERIKRIESGNYGDFKQIDFELYELRFNFSSGYRLYYSEINNTIILLLCGGDKSTQNKDIKKAKEYLNTWRQNNEKFN